MVKLAFSKFRIEELREKYVKIGTEEQRRLNRAKEERIKEVEQKFDLLKLEVNVKMENVGIYTSSHTLGASLFFSFFLNYVKKWSVFG